VEFRTKPQIALALIDRALGNGVRVSAWGCDAFYGRDGKFLDALEARKQVGCNLLISVRLRSLLTFA
jgi:SRSO17 transposase